METLKLMGGENSSSPIRPQKFCSCKQITGTYAEIEEFGYRDMCSTCNLPLEDGFHYYDHYDGEDHTDSEW